MSLLEIKDLSLEIHGEPILNKVSMQVAPGRVLGVIGESGSGKSMTAFSVLQLLPNGSECQGHISLAGRNILSATEEELCSIRGRDAGMVFQEPMTALNPLQTIGAQVAETILVHERVPKSEALARAADALRRAELPPEKFPLTRYPHELSGGQRQRVVIAMAIALRPKLLIADEPTTALDVTTQAQILDLLKRLVAEEGMGLMLISHDLAVVADLADELVIMRSGDVVESGPAHSLFRNMQHPLFACPSGSIRTCAGASWQGIGDGPSESQQCCPRVSDPDPRLVGRDHNRPGCRHRQFRGPQGGKAWASSANPVAASRP